MKNQSASKKTNVLPFVRRQTQEEPDEVAAEILPLTNGGIVITTEIGKAELEWEFDRDQAATFIQALNLALRKRQSVTLLQPTRKTS